MKLNRAIGLSVLLLTLCATQSALAFYNPSTGRWLNRDPLHELSSSSARFEFLRAAGLDEATADSIAEKPPASGVYALLDNDGIRNRDFLGLLFCADYTASGTFTQVNEIKHKALGVRGNHLTFTACCTCFKPSSLRLSSPVKITSPSDEPFPDGWWIKPLVPVNSVNGCYTVYVAVPWRATPSKNSTAALNGIMLNYQCCSRYSRILY